MNGTNGDFTYTNIEPNDYCDNPQWIDFADLYKQACSELTLQQTKRDQVIYGFVFLFSFITPILFSLEKMTISQRGLMLLAIFVIGLILSVIIIRYRIYKEAYWITCLTITQLRNLKDEAITKRNIQAMFFLCMKKKWGKYVYTNQHKQLSFHYGKIFWGNLFSAESLHYVLIAFLTSIAAGFGLYLVACDHFAESHLLFSIICVAVGILIFALQLLYYYHNLILIYRVLIDYNHCSFNFTFSKAWFLHFYRDNNEPADNDAAPATPSAPSPCVS